MVSSVYGLILMTALANALTFTSPTSGTTLDPSQDMTVTWTSTADDPSTFNLYVGQTMGSTTLSSNEVQTGISTSSGTFQVPAGTILTYGANFVFQAQDSTGSTIATSDPFVVAIGQNQVSTSNGMTVLATSLTAVNTEGGSTATAAASGSAASATVSPSGSTASTTGFSTSTTSRTGSSTSGSGSSRTSSASGTAATTSANAQPRLGSSGQLVMGAAGVLAGVVALVA